jgi:hypothetical protein
VYSNDVNSLSTVTVTMRYILTILATATTLPTILSFRHGGANTHGQNLFRGRCSTDNNCIKGDLGTPLLSHSSDTSPEYSGVKSALKDAFGHLFSIGDGQTFGVRSSLQKISAKRSFSDPQIWTHIFFLMDGILAVQNNRREVILLTCITAPLSFVYHYTYEKPGLLAKTESFAAKLSYIYGVIQIFKAPSIAFSEAEAFLALLTASIFVVTNVKKDLYDKWHCLMHVIPPIWVAIVIVFHAPLLDVVI